MRSFVIELLESFLPQRYKVENRKRILSKLGKESSEHDIIIWDQFSYPKIFSDFLKKDFRFFLNEMVSTSIEVKNTLTLETLENAFKKIRDYRRKMLEGIHATYFNGPKFGYHEPLYFIFAFDMEWKRFSALKKNIRKVINENDSKPHERFDYLFVFKKGIIVQWAIPEQFREKNEENIKSKKEFKDTFETIENNVYSVPTFMVDGSYGTVLHNIIIAK